MIKNTYEFAALPSAEVRAFPAIRCCRLRSALKDLCFWFNMEELIYKLFMHLWVVYGPVSNAFDAGSIHYEGKLERVGPWKSRPFLGPVKWHWAEVSAVWGPAHNMACGPDHKLAFLFQLTKWPLYSSSRKALCSGSQNGLRVSAHKMTSVQYSSSQKALCSCSQNGLLVSAHKMTSVQYSSSQKALCSCSQNGLLVSAHKWPLYSFLARKMAFLFQLTKWPLFSIPARKKPSVPAHKMAFLFQLTEWPLYSIPARKKPFVPAHKMTCVFQLTKWPLHSSSQNLFIPAHKMTSAFQLTKWPLHSISQNGLLVLAHKWPLYSIPARKKPSLPAQKLLLFWLTKIASVQRFPLLISFRWNTKRKSLNTGRERTDHLCNSHVSSKIASVKRFPLLISFRLNTKRIAEYGKEQNIFVLPMNRLTYG